jgi:hypothetical protein
MLHVPNSNNAAKVVELTGIGVMFRLARALGRVLACSVGGLEVVGDGVLGTVQCRRAGELEVRRRREQQRIDESEPRTHHRDETRRRRSPLARLKRIVLRLGHRRVDAVIGPPRDQRICGIPADADPVHLPDPVGLSANAAS